MFLVCIAFFLEFHLPVVFTCLPFLPLLFLLFFFSFFPFVLLFPFFLILLVLTSETLSFSGVSVLSGEILVYGFWPLGLLVSWPLGLLASWPLGLLYIIFWLLWRQRWANSILTTKYDYEYIRSKRLKQNTNMNIFGSKIKTEYKYECIRLENINRIQILFFLFSND